MKLTSAEKLRIYRRNLAKYEAEGNAERVRVQKLMIAKVEAEG